MTSQSFDLVVIGAGPGGYVAAIRAAQLGMNVAIVEKAQLGGVCLNWGCIPTKTLLRSAEVYHNMQNASQFGLSAEKIGFSTENIVKRSRVVAKKLNGGVTLLLKKNKVSVIMGEALIVNANTIKVASENGDSNLTTKNIIIATGARPRIITGLVPDKNLIWDYVQAMIPSEIPQSLFIIGSGAIGIEFATFYATFGSKVTIVEAMDSLIPAEDWEISKIACLQMKKSGITMLAATKLIEAVAGSDNVSVTIEESGGKRSVHIVDKVISAVGVVANVSGLGLEGAGIECVNGHIKTDGFGRTNIANIYAIGDVAGAPMLAHKASHDAIIAVETIAGHYHKPIIKDHIPRCTYGYPQIASIGLTEKQALAQGYVLKIGRFPFSANGKAIALGEERGLVKTIFDDKSGQLLGAHLVGAEVTELIHSFAIAMELETTEAELMQTIFPHPTLSEMIHESVLDAYDRAIHI